MKYTIHWYQLFIFKSKGKGCIICNEDGLTSRENIYAGGDAVSGAATVINAMGAGKRAAAAIDKKLKDK